MVAVSKKYNLQSMIQKQFFENILVINLYAGVHLITTMAIKKELWYQKPFREVSMQKMQNPIIKNHQNWKKSKIQLQLY